MTSLSADPPSLISEDGRDTAMQHLQEAYAEGHISHEELDERLHQVLTAKTRSELVSPLTSLLVLPAALSRRGRPGVPGRLLPLP